MGSSPETLVVHSVWINFKMLTSLLAILFLLQIRLSRSTNIADYLRQKYDGPTFRSYRRLESSTKKLEKAHLDHEFLLYSLKMGSSPETLVVHSVWINFKMLTSLLAILFLLQIRLSRSTNIADYLRQKYDGPTFRSYRRLESSTKKLEKAHLDHEFLLYSLKMGSSPETLVVQCE